jgi:hypothetical protein
MACLYPSYLKQFLGQTLVYKILFNLKTSFYFKFLKNTFIIYVSFSCLLCNLYFKINFYKSFKFIIGAEVTN